MGVSRNRRVTSGQMTVELMVALPALIIVAVIAWNAMTFFAECAVFDRVVHEAVRIHAAAPAYGQGVDQSCALVQETVRAQLDDNNLNVTVEHGVTGADFDAYTATLEYYPTLFGASLRSEVFGISLPRLSHTTRYVVDGYKAGVIV